MATRTARRRDASSEDVPKQRPAHTIRYGRLKVSIWKQESDKGPWYNAVPSRTYRDQGGNWQSSDSYGRDELLLLAKLANDANTWIWRQLAKEAATNAGGQVDGGEDPGEATDIPF